MWQRIILVTLALVVLLFVATLGHDFFASRQIAFRDGAHFYYPLHQTLKTRGLGVFFDDTVDNVWRESIVANPTSGVFYPITWILLLTLPTPFDEHLIILVHLIIAAVTTRRLARSLRVSPLAATFAGFVYASSGSVLFQMHNIIFLIGAAWLPEAVRLILVIKKRQRLRDAVWLSVVVSLMIFGGDIQAVAHLALFGLALVAWSFTRSLRLIALLALSVFIVILVTSVQWIPTINVVLQSTRIEESHVAIANWFCVPLLQFLDFVYPHYQQYTRWTPSLYAGIIPVVLVILSLRLWGNTRLVVLTWCLLITCVAAMGRDFGVYALLEMIPGYWLFRYPAKWITVASLPFSLLAAVGFDTITSTKNNRNFIRATLVTLTLLDVLVMNATLVLTASRESFDIARAEPLQRLIAEHITGNMSRPPRLFRMICTPPEWCETTFPTRIDAWIARDVATLAPRYHWLLPPAERIDVLPCSWTFMPRDVASLLHRTKDGMLVPNDWQSVTQLGIDFFLVSDTISLPEAWLQHLEQVSSDKYKLPPGVTLWRRGLTCEKISR